MWGKPEDGNASATPLKTTLLSAIAPLLARSGVQEGAYVDLADAALVTADNLAALGATLVITRLPAPYSECGRGIAEAVAQSRWEAVGVLAQTPPTKHRPGTFATVAERGVPFHGKASRAVVVHSSSQDQRRPKHLAREFQASAPVLGASVHEAAPPEYFCRADAEAAATKVRALPSASHRVEGIVEAHPKYGPGRPRLKPPRVVKALRYGLQVTRHARAEGVARQTQETAWCVLLTHVPTTGEMAHRAGEVRRAYKEPHGIEQHFGFLKDPLMVNRLFLKKPERIEALGWVCVLALRIWRLMERSRRRHVETPGNALPGGEKKETMRPTAFMMMTKCASVLVLKVGPQRPRAQAFSAVQQQ